MNIFGARAEVYIKYIGGLEELAHKIGSCMQLPEVQFDSDMDPPHEIIGFWEVMGFELFLEKSKEVDGYSFLFSLETELSLEAVMNNNMYDLSPWLSHFISKICGLESYYYH